MENGMTMVERVAKALHEKLCEQDVNGYLDAKIDCGELAMAVVEAMRDPTEAMILSQGKSKPENAPTESRRQSAENLNRSVRRMAKVTYQEMIDAALKENEGERRVVANRTDGLEITDGQAIYRHGDLSVTITAETAIVYRHGSGISAEKVPLGDGFWEASALKEHES